MCRKTDTPNPQQLAASCTWQYKYTYKNKHLSGQSHIFLFRLQLASKINKCIPKLYISCSQVSIIKSLPYDLRNFLVFPLSCVKDLSHWCSTMSNKSNADICHYPPSCTEMFHECTSKFQHWSSITCAVVTIWKSQTYSYFKFLSHIRHNMLPVFAKVHWWIMTAQNQEIYPDIERITSIKELCSCLAAHIIKALMRISIF